MTTQTPTRAAIEETCGRRLSTAIEQLRNAPDKLRIGRYSRGIEQMPKAPDKLRIGRYSRGIEQMPNAPGKLRRGSFADSFAASK
jgi:hypothetical protein